MRQRWPGVGERICQRLKELGYVSARTKSGADLMRFSLERSYPITYLQKWSNDGATPDRENILRLAKDLGVSLEWLLIGDGEDSHPPKKKARRLHPIAGGSADLAYITPESPAGITGIKGRTEKTSIESLVCEVPLIRHWLHNLVVCFWASPKPCYA